MAEKKVVKEDVPLAEEKSKKCFVIMPIADMPGYESNHFARVYKHLIKPALAARGFEVERADDTQESDYIVIGIVQKIIESDIVLCDLSGRNPNVLYELGIRHAFDKPVVLIKDKITDTIFDIQGLRYFEYDSSLRIDSVEHDISKIANAVDETFSQSGNSVNSIVALAQVQAPKIPAKTEISTETQVILNAVSALAKKMEGSDAHKNRSPRAYFAANSEGVSFSDGTKSKFGEHVFRRSDYQIVGTLSSSVVNALRAESYIEVLDSAGNLLRFFSSSPESEFLTGMPF